MKLFVRIPEQRQMRFLTMQLPAPIGNLCDRWDRSFEDGFPTRRDGFSRPVARGFSRVFSYFTPFYAVCHGRPDRNSFNKLCVKQMSCHSAFAWSFPRKLNRRNRRHSLICPNTGSTIAFRIL